MGCICSKSSRTGDDTPTDSPTQRGCSFKASASTLRLRNPSKLEELVAAPPESQSAKSKVIVQPPDNVLVIPIPSTVDRKFERAESQLVRHSERQPTQRNSTVGVNESQGVWVGRVPKQIEAEQVAAGWPSWLASVAGEAIKGWVPRRADSFEKLDKIGQGTYSHVYRARDLETGKIVALKKVRFVNMDPESVRFMAREILILRRLDHPNILKLEGLVTSRMSCGLYLVFEYMEHDLAGLAATPGLKFTEPQVKCYMQQLLSGLEHCHNRGVLHRDIKGSNILIDNNGNLQIADFGLATLFNPEQSQPLTSRVVTLWYRPPELLLGATNYGVAVDLWSAGCILAELLAGKPIMPGRTEVEQLHKIFKLCGSPSEDYWRKWKLPHATLFKPQHPYKRCLAETFKDFPASALSLLDRLLAVEPTERGTSADALKSEFFTTQPLACDPSSIPKYPPSKEFDAKLRNEARRQRTTGEKTQEPSNRDRVPKETGRRQTPEGNGDLQSFQSHGDQPNPKSCGGNYITPMDDADSGFSAGPSKARSRGAARNSFSHLGLLNHPGVFGPICNGKQKEDENKTVRDQAYIGSSKGANASNCAELRTQRSCMPQMEVSNKGVQHQRQKQILNKYSPMEVVDSPETTQWTHHLVDRPTTTTHKKDERAKEAATTYGQKKNRIHYSGPLLPPSANIDEMLKEHERQIQAAVRKARLDKVKSKKN